MLVSRIMHSGDSILESVQFPDVQSDRHVRAMRCKQVWHDRVDYSNLGALDLKLTTTDYQKLPKTTVKDYERLSKTAIAPETLRLAVASVHINTEVLLHPSCMRVIWTIRICRNSSSTVIRLTTNRLIAKQTKLAR